MPLSSRATTVGSRALGEELCQEFSEKSSDKIRVRVVMLLSSKLST